MKKYRGCGATSADDARFCSERGKKIDGSRRKTVAALVAIVSLVALCCGCGVVSLFCPARDFEWEWNEAGTGRITRWRDREAREVFIPGRFRGIEIYGVGPGAFRGMTKLERATFESSTPSLGDYAFDGCVALKTVDFGKNELFVGVGGKRAFAGTGITSIKLTSSVAEGAFADCKSLERVEVDSLREIGAEAFAGCEALTTFANSGAWPQIEKIGAKAFEGCKSLRRLYLGEEKPEIASDAFEGCSPDLEVSWGVGVMKTVWRPASGAEPVPPVWPPRSLEESSR